MSSAPSAGGCPLLVDIGANLTHPDFAPDLPAVLQRAQAHGVRRIVVTAADENDSLAAAELAQRWPAILSSTVGIHPHQARHQQPGSEAALRHLAQNPAVVALGECGLDYCRDYSPRPLQRQCFEMQLALAAEIGLPLFLHQRDAHADFVALLSRYRSRLSAVVVHCFTADAAALEDYLALDCHIGITAWIGDRRRGRHLPELVARIPEQRLMLETDAPYLLPADIRPRPQKRRNEPAFLPHVLALVAQARGETAETTADHCWQVSQRFFAFSDGQDCARSG